MSTTLLKKQNITLPYLRQILTDNKNYQLEDNFYLLTDITKKGDKLKTIYLHLVRRTPNGLVGVGATPITWVYKIPKKTWRKLLKSV